MKQSIVSAAFFVKCRALTAADRALSEVDKKRVKCRNFVYRHLQKGPARSSK